MPIASWRERVSSFVLKAAVVGISLSVTLGAAGVPTGFSFGTLHDPVQPSSSSVNVSNDKPVQGQAAYQQERAKLDRLYAALDVVNSKIDRSLFDVDALAARLGSDPAAIFHFVRNNIRYEPYTGVLRGALGTLLCRAGNSLDRSLLLAALLQKAGFTTQIAAGQLTAQQAQTLVNRLFELVKPVPSAMPSLEALAPAVSRALGVDPAKFSQTAANAQSNGARQQKELIGYADAETNVLSNLLAKAGVDVGVVASNAQLVAEAREHYWVQYRNSSGHWVDLDSSFADAEPGKAVARMTNTFAPDSLPDELYHHLQITLTLRVAQVTNGNDGPTTDTMLLNQGLRVADQQGKDIVVANVPQPIPSLLKLAANLGNSLAAIKGYQAVLQIGTQAIAGKYFDLDGKISNRLPSAEGEIANNAGGLGGAFGALGGGAAGALGGSSSSGPASRIVGEWVDYKLISPTPNGGQPLVRTYHRDIIAPVVVQSWSEAEPNASRTIPAKLTKEALKHRLLWSTDLLPFTGTVMPDYLGHLLISSFEADRGLLEYSLESAYGVSSRRARVNPSPESRMGSLALVAAVANVVSEMPGGAFPSLKTYFNSPGLIAYEIGTPDPFHASSPQDVNLATMAQGYDLISFAPRIAESEASSGQLKEQAARLHLLFGVLATRLEWTFGVRSEAGPASARPPVFNATRVFAASEKSGLQQLVLLPGRGLRGLASASLSDSVKAEISLSLASGYTIAVPASTVHVDGVLQVGWWRLDTRSGELIGIMPGGRGQEMTEEAIEEEEVSDGRVFLKMALSSAKCSLEYGMSNKDVDAFKDMCKCSMVVTIGGLGGFIGGTFEKCAEALEAMEELTG